MDGQTAKRELLENSFRYSLDQLIQFYAETGDGEALADLQAMATAEIKSALGKWKAAGGLLHRLGIILANVVACAA